MAAKQAFVKFKNTHKIVFLFFLFVLGFGVSIFGFYSITEDENNQFSIKRTQIEEALRGNIYSAEGKLLSSSSSSYYLALNPQYLVPSKKELFIDTFHIYTGIRKKHIRKKLKQKSRVIFIKNLDEKTAIQLKALSQKLDYLEVFKTFTVGTKRVRRGLEITKRNPLRSYPQKNLLEPVLGSYNYRKQVSLLGLEKQYENILMPKQEGKIQSSKDVLGNIIYNEDSSLVLKEDGSSLVLHVNYTLQSHLERLLDAHQTKTNATEVLGVVMDSTKGYIYALGSSNRYNPQKIQKSTIKHMKVSAAQHLFEPGSIVKPLVLAYLLDKKRYKLDDVLDTENGTYRIARKVIRDTHPEKWQSVENSLIYSSNVAFAKMSQEITAINYRKYLVNLGFSQSSNIDLPYEEFGSLPNMQLMKYPITKASLGYGYGLNVNFLQIIKAFNIFNNHGKMIDPKLAKYILEFSYYDQDEKSALINIEHESRQIVGKKTADDILMILRKTVLKGTGKKAQVDNIFTAGKTGTAHIFEKGGYKKLYHSSFIGFANDKKSKFTIGVLFIKPQKTYFSSKTAAPLFKEIVLRMVDLGWLKTMDAQNTQDHQASTKPKS